MIAGTPGAEQNNIYSGVGKTGTLKSTPSVFGGSTFNYAISGKLNLNLNAWYSSTQVYYHVSSIVLNDGVHGIDNIASKLIINANLSYEAARGLSIFCTGKNILNNKAREFFKTDDTPFMLLGGFNYTF